MAYRLTLVHPKVESLATEVDTSMGYRSEGSFEEMTSSPFAPMVDSNTSTDAGRNSLGSLGSSSLLSRDRPSSMMRNSMSMSALSSATPAFQPTSSTYEQYFSNINENEEDGIFF
jgi:hypothetical protein